MLFDSYIMTINIGQCADRFEETGIEIYFSKTTLIRFVRFRGKRVWSRRWSSEVQGLVATNPEDISKMDVVGIVPSVPFEPGTDLYGRMLSGHRQVGDGHSK